MKKQNIFSGLSTITINALYWVLLITPVAVSIGSLVAFFLWALDKVTLYRVQHLPVILFLPLAGVFISFLYRKWGKNAAGGNNLIIDEIHKPGGGIPFRMAPLVLLSTLVTHLFGGSAGREGTAVQMGGSVSALFGRWYGSKPAETRVLLLCGISAGFGAVFGTPVTGAVFAMEVLTIGKVKYDALLPCLFSSLLSHIVCTSFGIQHTKYSILFTENVHQYLPFISFDIVLLLKVMVAGALFGLTSLLFSRASHSLKRNASAYITNPYLVPVIGGVLVIIISYLLGTPDYLGLGVTAPRGGISIVSSFVPGGVTTWSWLWKLILTIITLSTGFKGGEVTPLFFIGAALGNTIATITGSPVDLFAGLGFIAVFAGATNTPLACTFMGVELFGAHNIVYYAVACFIAYYCSGHQGIYTSQPVAVRKTLNR